MTVALKTYHILSHLIISHQNIDISYLIISYLIISGGHDPDKKGLVSSREALSGKALGWDDDHDIMMYHIDDYDDDT